MRKFKSPDKKRLLLALMAGVIAHGLYKLYLYANNRAQFEDSNALVSLVFILIAAAVIYAVLKLASAKSSK